MAADLRRGSLTIIAGRERPSASLLDVAVIGAGPAGLMAAETLALAGATVTVYDRMPSVGRKLLMAGRGGLNLTHSEELGRFAARYGDAAHWLWPAIERFPPDGLRAWAEALGQPTLVGSSGRVFPRAWKASPLLRAWLGRLDGLGVRLALRHRWTGWTEAGRFSFDAPGGSVEIAPAATVLALGGGSWPRLGSDGGWAGILAGTGIGVAPLRPSNCALLVDWSDIFRDRFAGEPLKRIVASLAGETCRGDAVVTATGLEGGVVYGLSGPVRASLDAGGTARLAIDLRPDLAEADLAAALARPRAKATISTHLRKAAGLSPIAIGLLRESAGRDLPSDPGELARLIKAAPITVTGTAGLDHAISSAGGVMRSEIDERFMLRAKPGIFVAGEMLDWDAPTGGYLLQACFATGVAAAEGVFGYFNVAERNVVC